MSLYGTSPTEYGKPLDDSYRFEGVQDYGTEQAVCGCGMAFEREVTEWDYQLETRCPACIRAAMERNGAA
jgi:hypothetical protein